MGEKITSAEHKRIEELCHDAEKAIVNGRLTKWEKEFVFDLEDMMDSYGLDAHLSVRQWEVIERLEKKVYST